MLPLELRLKDYQRKLIQQADTIDELRRQFQDAQTRIRVLEEKERGSQQKHRVLQGEIALREERIKDVQTALKSLQNQVDIKSQQSTSLLTKLASKENELQTLLKIKTALAESNEYLSVNIQQQSRQKQQLHETLIQRKLYESSKRQLIISQLSDLKGIFQKYRKLKKFTVESLSDCKIEMQGKAGEIAGMMFQWQGKQRIGRLQFLQQLEQIGNLGASRRQ